MKQNAIVLILGTLIAVCAETACAQQPTISLTITVETQSGAPIANAPFEAVSRVQSRFAMTDVNGQANFAIVAAETEETLVVRMSDGGFTPLVPPELRDEATDRFHALRRSHAFKPYYIIPITGQQALATIRPQDAVTITGRLVDANGNPTEGVVGVRGRVDYDFVFDSEAGVFEIGGVAKGLPAELWFGSNTQLHMISLTDIQTAQSTSIGDVLLADTPVDGGATIVMQNTATMQQPDKMRLDIALSLVAVDDAEVHGFDVHSDGRAYWTSDESTPVYTFQVPAGTYYVTPGALGDLPFFALYESVKAGRQAQLTAAGVPTITILPGQTTDLTFDGQAALDAVMSVGGDLVEE